MKVYCDINVLVSFVDDFIRAFGKRPSELSSDVFLAKLHEYPEIGQGVTWSTHGKVLFTFLITLMPAIDIVVIYSNSLIPFDNNAWCNQELPAYAQLVHKSKLLSLTYQNQVSENDILIESLRKKAQTPWKGCLIVYKNNDIDTVINEVKVHVCSMPNPLPTAMPNSTAGAGTRATVTPTINDDKSLNFKAEDENVTISANSKDINNSKLSSHDLVAQLISPSISSFTSPSSTSSSSLSSLLPHEQRLTSILVLIYNKTEAHPSATSSPLWQWPTPSLLSLSSYSFNDYVSIVFGLSLVLKLSHSFYSSQGTDASRVFGQLISDPFLSSPSSTSCLSSLCQPPHHPQRTNYKSKSLYNAHVKFLSSFNAEKDIHDFSALKSLVTHHSSQQCAVTEAETDQSGATSSSTISSLDDLKLELELCHTLYITSKYVTDKLCHDSKGRSHQLFWKQICSHFTTARYVAESTPAHKLEAKFHLIRLAYLNYTIALKPRDWQHLHLKEVVMCVTPLMTLYQGLEYLACSLNKFNHQFNSDKISSSCSDHVNMALPPIVNDATFASIHSLPSLFQSEHHLRVLSDALLWSARVDDAVSKLKAPGSRALDRQEAADRSHSLLILLRQTAWSMNLNHIVDYKTISSHHYINLCYAGHSLSWRSADIEKHTHCYFQYAKLYHIYPIWQITKGLLKLTGALSGEGKLLRWQGFTDISHEVFRICIEVCKMLLWTEVDYNNSAKFRDLIRTSSVAIQNASSGVSSSTGGNHNNNIQDSWKYRFIFASFVSLESSPFNYAYDALKSARGFAYERLLNGMFNAGCSQKEIHDLFARAVDDPVVTKEYNMSLIEHRHHFLKPRRTKGSKKRRRSSETSANEADYDSDYDDDSDNDNEGDTGDRLEDSESSPNKNLFRSEAIGGFAAGYDCIIDDAIKYQQVEKISSNSDAKSVNVRYIFSNPIPNLHALATSSSSSSSSSSDGSLLTHRKSTRLWFNIPTHPTHTYTHTDTHTLSHIDTPAQNTDIVRNTLDSNISAGDVFVDFNWPGSPTAAEIDDCLHFNLLHTIAAAGTCSHGATDDITITTTASASATAGSTSACTDTAAGARTERPDFLLVEELAIFEILSTFAGLGLTQASSPGGSSSGDMTATVDADSSLHRVTPGSSSRTPRGVIAIRMKDRNRINALNSSSTTGPVEEEQSLLQPLMSDSSSRTVKPIVSDDDDDGRAVYSEELHAVEPTEPVVSDLFAIEELDDEELLAPADATDVPLVDGHHANRQQTGVGVASGIVFCNPISTRRHNSNRATDTTTTANESVLSRYNDCILAAWSESTLWFNMLFLLFWEEIFDPSVAYALPRRWMNRPADLYPEGYGNIIQYHSTKFFYRRKNKINANLLKIKNYTKLELKYEICQSYCMHRGSPCFGLRWDKVNLFEVASLAVAIGGARLAVVCETMLTDFETYYRGMPDLIFWKVDKKVFASRDTRNSSSKSDSDSVEVNPYSTVNDSNINNEEVDIESSLGVLATDTVLVVEVKNNKDTLSKWQILWMELLARANIPVEICKQIPIDE